MRNLSILTDIVRSIALVSAAAAPFSAAGCGGQTTDGVPPTADASGDATHTPTDARADWPAPNETVCTGDSYDPLAGITPAKPVDYVALVSQYGIPGQDAGYASSTPAVLSQHGTPCATATDPSTCTAKLGTTTSDAGWTPGPDYGWTPEFRYLKFTRGDSVDLVTSLVDLASFIGPVDSARDAALLVSQSGYRFECPGNNARATDNGYELIALQGSTCGASTHLDRYRLAVSSTGGVTVLDSVRIKDGDPNCVVGRRPEGLVPCGEGAPSTAPAGATPAGEFLAGIARLEAAAIVAFEVLAAELAYHKAPAELVDAALRARADEVEHARVVKKLATSYGGEVTPPVVWIGPPRSLLRMAIENAAEGCVRETFGAAVAALQAVHAEDAALRRAAKTICEDETRHAALSWDVDAWLRTQLSADEIAQVDRARRDAVDELRAGLDNRLDPRVRRVTGMPDPARAREAFKAMEAALWG